MSVILLLMGSLTNWLNLAVNRFGPKAPLFLLNWPLFCYHRLSRAEPSASSNRWAVRGPYVFAYICLEECTFICFCMAVSALKHLLRMNKQGFLDTGESCRGMEVRERICRGTYAIHQQCNSVWSVLAMLLSTVSHSFPLLSSYLCTSLWWM